MICFCFFCGTKISKCEIFSKRRIAGVSQCPRFLYLLRCGQCKNTFNYRCLQKHKELFENTLIDINRRLK